MNISQFPAGSIIQASNGLTLALFVFSQDPPRGCCRWPAKQNDSMGLLQEGWDYPELDQVCRLLDIDQRMLTVEVLPSR